MRLIRISSTAHSPCIFCDCVHKSVAREDSLKHAHWRKIEPDVHCVNAYVIDGFLCASVPARLRSLSCVGSATTIDGIYPWFPQRRRRTNSTCALAVYFVLAFFLTMHRLHRSCSPCFLSVCTYCKCLNQPFASVKIGLQQWFSALFVGQCYGPLIKRLVCYFSVLSP